MILDFSLLAIFAFAFGAIVGSFLNVLILRLPDPTQSIIFPSSHCPSCHTPLHWYENIPIISYLSLRGRCRSCDCKISWQYPVVELLMAFLTVALLYRFQFSTETFAYFIFSAALVTIIFIDIRLQIIPDVISLPGIFLGIIYSFMSHSVTWQDSLIGALAGGGVLYAVALLYVIVRKVDGMGGGDIKLLGMIGSWLGWQSLPFVIFFSSATGSIIGLAAMFIQKKGGKTRIPFGPFLSVAALIYLFFKNTIMHFYFLYLSGQWP